MQRGQRRHTSCIHAEGIPCDLELSVLLTHRHILVNPPHSPAQSVRFAYSFCIDALHIARNVKWHELLIRMLNRLVGLGSFVQNDRIAYNSYNDA